MLEPKYIVKFGEKLPNQAYANHGEASLNVSEFFFDTIQGEGLGLGQPAAFLRLAGCTVGCKFCDTTEVWSKSNRVKISWLVDQIFSSGLNWRFRDGEMLVVTGGSPLLQQDGLIRFFRALEEALPDEQFPYVEVENECVFVPKAEITEYVNWWNNSPKLSNSQVPENRRYNPKALAAMKDLPCTFKFVVKDEEDWEEIQEKYIDPGYVTKGQIVLMPMGATQKEYIENREKVVEIAVACCVRYSPREHIAIWDKKTGI